MILTNNQIRRKRYKQLWYQRNKAKKDGDKGRYNAIEAEIDKIRKVKREPKARKIQLKKRAIYHKKRYEKLKKLGVFNRISRRYRERHLDRCHARERRYRLNLSPKMRKQRLISHRIWDKNHATLIRKRSRDYARTHRNKARANARRYYYRHKNQKIFNQYIKSHRQQLQLDAQNWYKNKKHK